MVGIGPKAPDQRALLERARSKSMRVRPRNELEIFSGLCVGRVFYQSAERRLFFVDSHNLSITDIIHTVFAGMAQRPRIRQLYMDEHNLIKAAFSIALTPRQARRLLVALRLNGIVIDSDGELCDHLPPIPESGTEPS